MPPIADASMLPPSTGSRRPLMALVLGGVLSFLVAQPDPARAAARFDLNCTPTVTRPCTDLHLGTVHDLGPEDVAWLRSVRSEGRGECVAFRLISEGAAMKLVVTEPDGDSAGEAGTASVVFLTADRGWYTARVERAAGEAPGAAGFALEIKRTRGSSCLR